MSTEMPLTVSGRFILDGEGHRLKLAGVNWAGAHQDQMVPGGLDFRPRQEIAEQLAEWGFNSVRFPFANGTIRSAGPVPAPLVSANPDLAGKTPWQVYQACVQALTGAGLMVIPNYHLLHEGWCCSEADGNGLWWNSNRPSSEFISNWVTAATAFAGNPLVIGYDLKNEPRKATIAGVTYTPSWGDGNGKTDFRQMYQTMATLIRKADPGALMFCEGLSYAGDLTQAGTHPVTGPGIIYSVHDYSWFHPAGQGQAAYVASMDAKSGYLMNGGKAPVWVGEFGTDNAHRATFTSGWFADFTAWARARDADWCWWLLDGTLRLGTTPQTGKLQAAEGDRSSFGLFSQSWQGPSNPVMLAQLQSLQRPRLGPGT